MYCNTIIFIFFESNFLIILLDWAEKPEIIPLILDQSPKVVTLSKSANWFPVVLHTLYRSQRRLTTLSVTRFITTVFNFYNSIFITTPLENW
jgi:hypothetical protein